ncbi:hypothetical protein P6E80_002029 [Campylobacter coli]|nr:hypothetical protein [Campylobacter jejuni]EFO4832197.1 hypothetical protein [Campylobacter coli]EGH5952897.1 hypothetical protein [Campylobacter coli]EGJ2911124.1 hypothetical protein [Campylobacter coli]EGQ2318298.1 hypothetical protein [Campylobacter jejuni]
MQSNIEKFDFYSAKILAFLLDEFPIKKDIYILKDIIKDSNATNEDKKFVYETIIALRDFGFISFKEEIQTLSLECFLGVRLTLKSLEILKSIPKTLQSNKTLGEKLKDSIDLADKEAIKQSVGFFFFG